MTYTLPAAVQRQTADKIEAFILTSPDESLEIRTAWAPDQAGQMRAWRMRWLRPGRRARFAVTTHPDGHATDSRYPGKAIDLRELTP